MYGQLLALAIEGEEPRAEPMSEHELVRELAQFRVRLAPRWSPGGGSSVDAVASLAAHVDYDRTLLRLCRLRGIACGPERFTRPEAERQRLEEALAAVGVSLAAAAR